MGNWLYAMNILALAVAAGGNREHKVHNIVLYPDKHSWCSTRNISQVISYPGCNQVTIDNNVCVGACFSYSIPHTEPSDPGEVIGPYCDSCQPSETSWHHVTLDCSENSNTNGDEEAKPTILVKRVQIIKNCSCTSCEKQTHKKHHHHHQEPNQIMQVPSTTASLIQNDIPELLEVVPYTENDTEPIHHSPVHSHQSGTHGTTYLQQHQLNHYEHNSHTDNVKKLLHQKISGLLKSIEETNSKHDREQLVEMIKLIKGSSDRNWDDLVESLQSENTILDFERLRNELEVDEDPEFFPKPGSPEQEDHERLLKHQFDILNHHSNQQSSNQYPPSSPSTHHHVAGEKLDQHHHLARGPHGALVITADEDDDVSRMNHGHEIKEKINIHPHELKPNHAGAILTYDNHHSEHPGGIGGGSAHHHHHHQHHLEGGHHHENSGEQSN
ncbi:lateral signaling target protein 2 homolog [Sabethes cyaneus]|uniref:lateral signaling target protein 2 homolog n=1 Tax=Sabethes cyaneus TaxID=53552 RepID=UPI00237EDA4C|nr:lateral signaling target protein 2 homolog [Sabethes cyaneus]XP_053690420.1 lateral signaling target protein 2 homolog [Sabethes cyaneus]XP_053690428.1 lateral signaling target protein 2 homolog [Sabethes cyaneus]